MKAQHSTEEAIQASIRCIQSGMPKLAIKHYLIKDGFKPCKANVIVRWAAQIIKDM